MDRSDSSVDDRSEPSVHAPQSSVATTALTDGPAVRVDDGELPAGTAIARYLVVSRLGAGGMGAVYLAYDPELDRRVALKVLHGTSAMRVADRRMQQLREAQALARLQHPNVVTIYDVGTFAETVWLSMELVEGRTLRAWCAERRHSWREILDVLVPAGRALAAAHAANLVHRDFKPDNVMVARDGRVLVMDFGLARTLGGAGEVPSERSPTQTSNPTSHAYGTPGYMAPEQHRAEVGDDRLDQFGFCVTSWEALFGQRPFVGDTMGALLLAVSEGELQAPPSDRRVPRWLRRALERGLQADPRRRWPSMTALLDELEKQRTRSRRRWITASTVGVALLVGAAVVGDRLRRTAALQRCADEAASISALWPGPREDTRAQVQSAFERTGALGGQTYTRVAPRLDAWRDEWARIAEISCTRALDEPNRSTREAAAVCLAERYDGFAALLESFAEPDVEVIRRAVLAVGGLARAEECDDARLLHRRAPPADAAPQVATLRRELERARSQRLAGHYGRGQATSEAALADARELGWPPIVAEVLLEAGRAADKAADPAAEQHLQAAFMTAAAADEPTLAADAAIALVKTVGISRARPDDGRLWALHAQALLERLGETEGVRAASLAVNRASIERVDAQFELAASLLEHAIALRRAALGDDHPEVAAALNNLANVHQQRSDYEASAALLERAVEIWESTLGPDHPDTAQSINGLGNIAYVRGRYDDAQRHYARALEIRQHALGPEHPDVAQSLFNLAAVAYSRGDYRLAIDRGARALEIDRRIHPGDHPDVARDLTNLATARAAAGENDEAARLFDECLQMEERLVGRDHPQVAGVLRQRAQLLRARGDLDTALADIERTLVIYERAELGVENVDVAVALVQLGEISIARGDAERAVVGCRRARETFARMPTHPDAMDASVCIVDALRSLGRAAEAVREGEDLLELAQASGVTADQLSLLRLALAQSIWDAKGDRTRARELARAAHDDGTRPDTRTAAERWLHAHP